MNMKTAGAWTLVVLAVPIIGYVALIAVGWLLDRLGDALHRARCMEARRQGWVQPRLTANWQVLNSADVRLIGVTGIEVTPDPGVAVSEWARHARVVQRRVEVAWLKGIDRGVAHELEVGQ